MKIDESAYRRVVASLQEDLKVPKFAFTIKKFMDDTGLTRNQVVLRLEKTIKNKELEFLGSLRPVDGGRPCNHYIFVKDKATQ